MGKSSFLKALLGSLAPEGGRILWGVTSRCPTSSRSSSGSQLRETVLQELWDRFPATYEKDCAQRAGEPAVFPARRSIKGGALSGGEKARLKFAIMMYEEGNVLLLDEPTNHLDLSTKEVLDRALDEYGGTILMVSHDRYLLSRIPTRIVEMFPDGMASYDGGYEAYLAGRQARRQAAAEKENAAGRGDNEYYRSKQQRAQEVMRKKRLVEVEQEISDLELAIAVEQNRLGEPQVSCDYQKVNEICAKLERMRNA